MQDAECVDAGASWSGSRLLPKGALIINGPANVRLLREIRVCTTGPSVHGSRLTQNTTGGSREGRMSGVGQKLRQADRLQSAMGCRSRVCQLRPLRDSGRSILAVATHDVRHDARIFHTSCAPSQRIGQLSRATENPLCKSCYCDNLSFIQREAATPPCSTLLLLSHSVAAVVARESVWNQAVRAFPDGSGCWSAGRLISLSSAGLLRMRAHGIATTCRSRAPAA